MKLEKYVKQLLQENEIVIIPGFGAFISEYLPAVVNDASGEILPPSSKLVFNPKIKNNDGLLVGQVAEATRSTHFEALQKIEKERDNILYQLDKGEKVELEGLGILGYNADKEIVLVSEEDKNLSLETFGLETTLILEPIEEKTGENIQEPDKEPVVEAEETEQTNTPEQEEVLTKEPREEEETKKPEPVTENKEENRVQEETQTPGPKEKKKRKAGWIWILVILIPLLAVSVFIFMKNTKTGTPDNVAQQPVFTETPPKTFIAADSTVADSTLTDSTDREIQDTTINNMEAEPSQTQEMVEGKFYLVGGSFKSEENAETYLQSLKEKGFDPFHLGKYGNFYIVGLGSYNTENEAFSAKREYLENNPGSGVWILER